MLDLNWLRVVKIHVIRLTTDQSFIAVHQKILRDNLRQSLNNPKSGRLAELSNDFHNLKRLHQLPTLKKNELGVSSSFL